MPCSSVLVAALLFAASEDATLFLVDANRKSISVPVVVRIETPEGPKGTVLVPDEETKNGVFKFVIDPQKHMRVKVRVKIGDHWIHKRMDVDPEMTYRVK